MLLHHHASPQPHSSWEDSWEDRTPAGRTAQQLGGPWQDQRERHRCTSSPTQQQPLCRSSLSVPTSLRNNYR